MRFFAADRWIPCIVSFGRIANRPLAIAKYFGRSYSSGASTDYDEIATWYQGSIQSTEIPHRMVQMVFLGTFQSRRTGNSCAACAYRFIPNRVTASCPRIGFSGLESTVYSTAWPHKLVGLNVIPTDHPLVRMTLEGALETFFGQTCLCNLLPLPLSVIQDVANY